MSIAIQSNCSAWKVTRRRLRFSCRVGLRQGSLPTPCNHLRVAVSAPNAKNRIFIDVYSVIDPNQICIQMLAPLEVNIPLGSFPPGHYSVWVNGEKIGEFDS